MKNVILAVILCLLGFAIYAQTLHAPFLFDDRSNIEINKNIHDIHDIKSIWNSHLGHPSRFIGFYSFALNYHFSQLDPYGYHLTNLIIHILNSFLAWWLAFQLLHFFERQLDDRVHSSERLGLKKLSHDKTLYELIAAHKDLLAYGTALIFLSHPGQTQAVSYITQRFASLATLFYLLSLNSYLACRKQARINIKSFAWALVALLSALCGFFTKEITITIPIMILFMEYYILSRASVRQTKTKQRLFLKIFLSVALLALILIIPSHFQFKIHHVVFGHQASESRIGEIITFPGYLLSQPRVFLIYFKRLLIPRGYRFEYDFSLSQHFFETRTWTSFLILLGMIAFVLIKQRKYPVIAFGFWWLIITFMANLVPRRNIVFEHKLYLLNFGMALAICMGVLRLLRKKQPFFACLLVMVAGYSLLTFQRNQVYLSKLSFWQDAAAHAHHKARPQIFLGHSYSAAGQYLKATQHFTKAMDFGTDKYWHVLVARVPALCRASQFDACIQDSQKALQKYSNLDSLYHDQGYAYYMKGEYTPALTNVNAAIRFKPKKADHYLLRAEIYIAMNQATQAQTDITIALNLDKSSAKAYALQAFLAARGQQEEKSAQGFQEALRLDPDEPAIYIYRGKIFQERRQFAQALAEVLQAITLHPDNVHLHIDHSKILLALNQPQKSLTAIERAFSLNSQLIEVYIQYGFVYQMLGRIDEAIHVITQAIEIEPERADLYYYRMRFYWTKRDYHNAELDAYEAIERGYPISRALLYELAERVAETQ